MSSNSTLGQRSLKIVKVSEDDAQSQIVRKRMGVTITDFMNSLECTEPVTHRSIESSAGCFVWPKHTTHELLDSSKPVYQRAANDIGWAVRFRALGCYHSPSLTPTSKTQEDLYESPITQCTPSYCQTDLNEPKLIRMDILGVNTNGNRKKHRHATGVHMSVVPSTDFVQQSLTSAQHHQLEEDLKLSDSEEEDLDATKPMHELSASPQNTPNAIDANEKNVNCLWNQRPESPCDRSAEPGGANIYDDKVLQEHVHSFPSFISPLSIMGDCSFVELEPINEVVVCTEPSVSLDKSAQESPHNVHASKPAISDNRRGRKLHFKDALSTASSLFSHNRSSSPSCPPKIHSNITNACASDPSFLRFEDKSRLDGGASSNRSFIQRLIAESVSVLTAKQNCFVSDLSPSSVKHWTTESSALAGKENRAIIESDGTANLKKQNVHSAQACINVLEPESLSNKPSGQQASNTPVDRLAAGNYCIHIPTNVKLPVQNGSSTPIAEPLVSVTPVGCQNVHSEPFLSTDHCHVSSRSLDPVHFTPSHLPGDELVDTRLLDSVKHNKRRSEKRDSVDQKPFQSETDGLPRLNEQFLAGLSPAFDRAVMPPPDHSTRKSKRSNAYAPGHDGVTENHSASEDVPSSDNFSHSEKVKITTEFDVVMPEGLNCAIYSPRTSVSQQLNIASLRSIPAKRWVFSDLALTKVRLKLQQIMRQSNNHTFSSNKDSLLDKVRTVLESGSSTDKESLTQCGKTRQRTLTGVLLIPTAVVPAINSVATQSLTSVPPIPRSSRIDAYTATSPLHSSHHVDACTQSDIIIEQVPSIIRNVQYNLQPHSPSTAHTLSSNVSITERNRNDALSCTSVVDPQESASLRDSTPDVQLQLADDLKSKASRHWKSLVNVVSKLPSSSRTSVGNDRSRLLLHSDDLHMYPIQLLQASKRIISAAYLCDIQKDSSRCADLLADAFFQLGHLVHRLQRIEAKLIKTRIRNSESGEVTKPNEFSDRVKRDASWMSLWFYTLSRLRSILRFKEYGIRFRAASLLKNEVSEDISAINLPLEPGDTVAQANDTTAIPTTMLRRLIRLTRLNEIVHEAMHEWEQSNDTAVKVPQWADGHDRSAVQNDCVPNSLDAEIAGLSGRSYSLNWQTNFDVLFSYIDGVVRAHWMMIDKLKADSGLGTRPKLICEFAAQQLPSGSSSQTLGSSNQVSSVTSSPIITSGATSVCGLASDPCNPNDLVHGNAGDRQQSAMAKIVAKKELVGKICTGKSKGSRKGPLSKSDHPATEFSYPNGRTCASKAGVEDDPALLDRRASIPGILPDATPKATSNPTLDKLSRAVNNELADNRSTIPKTSKGSLDPTNIKPIKKANKHIRAEQHCLATDVSSPDGSVSSSSLSRNRQRSKSLAPPDKLKHRSHKRQIHHSPPQSPGNSPKDNTYHPKRIRTSSIKSHLKSLVYSDGSDGSPPVPSYKPSKAIVLDDEGSTEGNFAHNMRSTSVGRPFPHMYRERKGYSPTRCTLHEHSLDHQCKSAKTDSVPAYHVSRIASRPNHQQRMNGLHKSGIDVDRAHANHKPIHGLMSKVKVPSFYTRWMNDTPVMRPTGQSNTQQ